MSRKAIFLKKGFILISALMLVLAVGIVGMLSLRILSTQANKNSIKSLEIKSQAILKSSKAIVLKKVIEHDFNISCLDKFYVDIDDFLLDFKLEYSHEIGKCHALIMHKKEQKPIPLTLKVTATISSKSKYAQIRKSKIFILKI